MTVGEGIFSSVAVASMVALYLGTKDRWRWKRIVLWLVGSVVALTAIAATGAWVSDYWQGRPKPATEYWSIKLGAGPNDVLFTHGQPTAREDGDTRWTYEQDRRSLLVDFKDGKVQAVLALAPNPDDLPSLPFQFSTTSRVEWIIKKLGEPSFVSISKDGTQRLYNWERYNLALGFDRHGMKVAAVTATGRPREFSDAQNPRADRPAPK